MDIVDYFRSIATANSYIFSAGTRSNHNLLQADKEANTIYLLLDPVTESDSPSEMGGESTRHYDGTFMLLVQGDLDQVWDTQKGTPKEKGKYEKNIKPLKAEVDKIRDQIDCSDYEREIWSRIAITNILDTTLDGIVVTFRLNTDA